MGLIAVTAENASPQPKRIFILTPVFNEEKSLPVYAETVRKVLMSSEEYAFRVLFVEDGSRDASWSVIADICRQDARFQGIRLSRNFGSHIALSAAFQNADADGYAILACDLQDPPEVILEFIRCWEGGAKIVWGHRRTRKDNPLRVIASNTMFRLMRRFAMPAGSSFTTGSFLFLDNMVVQGLRQFHEQNRITFALVAWTGFEQAVVKYDRHQRQYGKSGWTFGRMIKTMYDAFIGFSFLPIRLMTILGAAIFLITIPFIGYLVLTWIRGNPLLGWTSLMTLMALFFGIQFLLMGVAGEYLHRIYAEAVHRPLFFISERTDDAPSDK